MSKQFYTVIPSYEQVDCFGSYNKNDPLCAKHCALRIRCAIEQDHNIRMEMLEELVASEDLIGRNQ
jgi:hypothetical protein